MGKRNLVLALAGIGIALAALAAGYWMGWGLGRQGGAAASAEAAAAAPEAEAKSLYSCAMHPTYVQEGPGKCPFCGMDLTPVAAAPADSAAAADGGAPGLPGASGAVRIDPSMVQNIGVRTEPVRKRPLSPVIRASGRITLDETRQYAVTARVEGWAERLRVSTTGQRVRKGEALLDLYSPDLVGAQEEYLQALRYARTLDLPRASGPDGAGRHATEARRAAADLLESAGRRLRNWDVPEARLAALAADGKVERTLPLVSPADGVVLEKKVVQGEKVMPGMPLYRIADLSRVWVVASVYQGDLARVAPGAPAEISLSYLPGRTFAGKVAFVSPVLDPQTRTAEVRVEAANTASLDLKPEMFAQVTLRLPDAGPVLAVPEQAVIRSGERDVAVVSLGGGRFEPREVELGRAAEGWVEVLRGLAEGEEMVVSSQFLIDSESNLRAAIHNLRGTRDTAAAPAGEAP